MPDEGNSEQTNNLGGEALGAKGMNYANTNAVMSQPGLLAGACACACVHVCVCVHVGGVWREREREREREM